MNIRTIKSSSYKLLVSPNQEHSAHTNKWLGFAYLVQYRNQYFITVALPTNKRCFFVFVFHILFFCFHAFELSWHGIWFVWKWLVERKEKKSVCCISHLLSFSHGKSHSLSKLAIFLLVYNIFSRKNIDKHHRSNLSRSIRKWREKKNHTEYETNQPDNTFNAKQPNLDEEKMYIIHVY